MQMLVKVIFCWLRNGKIIKSRFYEDKISAHSALKSLAVAKAMPAFFALIGLKF